MKKNYDIYNDDFNELSGNYKDLVNQPTMGDAFAEAFSKAGSNPAPGPQSAIANAILNGMSAGFKGSENVIKQQKLEPLYKMVAENTARAAEIRAQVQEAKQNELAFKKFADIATPTVAAWAEQVKNGDPRSNITFTGLIDQLSRTVPQFNKYTADHWNTAKGFGLLLNKETGEHLKISADEIMQAIAPRAKEIYGDRWFEKFDGLSAGLAKDAAYAFNMQRQEDALGLEGKRADISNKYSQAEVHNAQAGLYNKQGQELDYKMSPEYLESERQKKSLDYRSDHNAKHYIPEISQKYQKNNEVLTSIDNFKKILNDTSLTGGSFGKRIARFVAEQTGNDEKILEAKNAGQFYFEWMNENSKGALSDRDIKLYTGTFADPEKNRTASINILNKLENKLKGQNTIYRKQLELYDKDPTANLHNLDLIQAPSNTNEVVTMVAPDGSTRPVPAAQVEYWKSKGAKVVDEQK